MLFSSRVAEPCHAMPADQLLKSLLLPLGLQLGSFLIFLHIEKIGCRIHQNTPYQNILKQYCYAWSHHSRVIDHQMIISLAPWRRERSSLSAAMSLGVEQTAAGGTSVRNGLKKEQDRWHPMTNGRHLRLMKCVLWCNAIWYDRYDAIWHDMMKCNAMRGDVMFCTVDTIWHIYI